MKAFQEVVEMLAQERLHEINKIFVYYRKKVHESECLMLWHKHIAFLFMLQNGLFMLSSLFFLTSILHFYSLAEHRFLEGNAGPWSSSQPQDIVAIEMATSVAIAKPLPLRGILLATGNSFSSHFMFVLLSRTQCLTQHAAAVRRLIFNIAREPSHQCIPLVSSKGQCVCNAKLLFIPWRRGSSPCRGRQLLHVLGSLKSLNDIPDKQKLKPHLTILT